MPASAAPPMATSHRPDATSRAAWAIEWAPAAHAVMTVSDGPCHPMRIDTAAAPALDIIIGTRRGRDPTGALLAVDEDLGLERLEATDPGAHDHPGPTGVGVELAGVGQGHVGHRHAELGEAVDVAGVLGGEPLLRIEVVDPALALGCRAVEARPERVEPRSRPTRGPRCR